MANIKVLFAKKDIKQLENKYGMLKQNTNLNEN